MSMPSLEGKMEGLGMDILQGPMSVAQAVPLALSQPPETVIPMRGTSWPQ